MGACNTRYGKPMQACLDDNSAVQPLHSRYTFGARPQSTTVHSHRLQRTATRLAAPENTLRTLNMAASAPQLPYGLGPRAWACVAELSASPSHSPMPSAPTRRIGTSEGMFVTWVCGHIMQVQRVSRACGALGRCWDGMSVPKLLYPTMQLVSHLLMSCHGRMRDSDASPTW